jgi:hypothetical protein
VVLCVPRFLGYGIGPAHDGEVAVGAAEAEEEAHEALGAAVIGGHLRWIVHLAETELGIEGGQGVQAGEPEWGGMVVLQGLDDRAGDAAAAIRPSHRNRRQLPAAVPVRFHLSAADNLPARSDGDAKSGPM